MRVTGIILALIGLIAGAICMVVLVNPTAPGRDAPPTNDGQVQRPSMVIPLGVSGACILIGGAMYMYGGRSFTINNNPRVTS